MSADVAIRDFMSPETMLPDLLARWPATRQVLDRCGLGGCGGCLGQVESIRFFARAHGVEQARLMRELEIAAEQPSSDSPAATCVAADTSYRRYFLAGILLVLTAGASW